MGVQWGQTQRGGRVGPAPKQLGVGGMEQGWTQSGRRGCRVWLDPEEPDLEQQGWGVELSQAWGSVSTCLSPPPFLMGNLVIQ